MNIGVGWPQPVFVLVIGEFHNTILATKTKKHFSMQPIPKLAEWADFVIYTIFWHQKYIWV